MAERADFQAPDEDVYDIAVKLPGGQTEIVRKRIECKKCAQTEERMMLELFMTGVRPDIR